MMLSLSLCVLAIGQKPLVPAAPAPIYAGQWRIVANTERGEFTLATAKGDQIYGGMYGGFWTGFFDPATNTG